MSPGASSPDAHAPHGAPPSPDPFVRSRAIFLAVSGAIAVAVVVAARQVLMPFVLALLLAYVLMPAVRRVERLRVPRWGAILIVYAVTLGSVGWSTSAVIPRLVAEGRSLADEWPKLNAVVRSEYLPAIDRKLAIWAGKDPNEARPPGGESGPRRAPGDKPAPFKLVKQPDGSYDVRVADGVIFREKRDGIWQIEQVDKTPVLSSAQLLHDVFDKAAAYVQENSVALINLGRKVVFAIGGGVFTLVWALMLGGYLMLTEERIFAFFRELCPPRSQGSFDRFVRRLDRGLSGVVRGQLIICLVNGVLSAIGFSLFGLKYWPLLAFIAGAMSIIPIFGSILSSVPSVAIGLTQSPATAFGVLVWIIGIHQLEANFLNPKIIGDSAKIHPVLVVFSLMAGEHFFQLPGALFAVPAFSIAQTVFLHFREVTTGVAPTALVTIPPPARVPAAPADHPYTHPSDPQTPGHEDRPAGAEG